MNKMPNLFTKAKIKKTRGLGIFRNPLGIFIIPFVHLCGSIWTTLSAPLEPREIHITS